MQGCHFLEKGQGNGKSQGNFGKSQGILKFSDKSGNFEKKSGNLDRNLDFKNKYWTFIKNISQWKGNYWYDRVS